MNSIEKKILEDYANVTKSKIFESQSDLNPKIKAMPAMLSWCREKTSIVVLQNGDILCSDPTSRLIQNCKSIMLNKGINPGQVHAATSTLIHILLENAEVETHKILSKENVSTQQQRLRMLVKEALEWQATDIHIEVREEIAKIRLRKHGELILHAEWLPKLAREIISVAFNKETDHAVSHFNSLIPQNASMPLIIDNQQVRLRLTSLPAHQGFDVVMRILTASAQETVEPLELLGYQPEQIRLIKKAINMPSGAVIVAGPTGAGKTTTLASCMQLVSHQRKVYSIEDPVEKIVSNVTQVPVNTEHYDRTFASMARTTLRMDPDVVVLGEMRDEDTARVLIRAAITGHLVFSTVHTHSAMDIITRLVDLGISSSLLSSSNIIVCLICQRLAPLLCQHCSLPIQQSLIHRPHLSRWYQVFTDVTQLKARGIQCNVCHNQGISGRTVAAEIIWLDAKGREYIQQGDLLAWKRHLKNNGWKTYQDRLIQMTQAGLCDPLDVEKLMGEINPFDETSFNYQTVI